MDKGSASNFSEINTITPLDYKGSNGMHHRYLVEFNGVNRALPSHNCVIQLQNGLRSQFGTNNGLYVSDLVKIAKRAVEELRQHKEENGEVVEVLDIIRDDLEAALQSMRVYESLSSDGD